MDQDLYLCPGQRAPISTRCTLPIVLGWPAFYSPPSVCSHWRRWGSKFKSPGKEPEQPIFRSFSDKFPKLSPCLVVGTPECLVCTSDDTCLSVHPLQVDKKRRSGPYLGGCYWSCHAMMYELDTQGAAPPQDRPLPHLCSHRVSEPIPVNQKPCPIR